MLSLTAVVVVEVWSPTPTPIIPAREGSQPNMDKSCEYHAGLGVGLGTRVGGASGLGWNQRLGMVILEVNLIPKVS